MRTTLNIDSRVLAIARARVSAGQHKSLGEAVSTLALAGLAAEPPPDVAPGGLVLLPAEPGQVITDEVVAEALLND